MCTCDFEYDDSHGHHDKWSRSTILQQMFDARRFRARRSSESCVALSVSIGENGKSGTSSFCQKDISHSIENIGTGTIKAQLKSQWAPKTVRIFGVQIRSITTVRCFTESFRISWYKEVDSQRISMLEIEIRNQWNGTDSK